MNMKNNLLWNPTQKKIKNTSLFEFIQHVNKKHKKNINSFENLHKWSVENRNYFFPTRFFLLSLDFKLKLDIHTTFMNTHVTLRTTDWRPAQKLLEKDRKLCWWSINLNTVQINLWIDD